MEQSEQLVFRRRPKRTSALKKRQLLFYIFLITLPLIQYAIFYLGVNFNSIKLAFTDTGGNFVGFKNFNDVFESFKTTKNWGILFFNSIKIWVLNFIIKTPIVFGISYFVYKKGRIGNTFQIAIFIPSILSIMVTIMIYEFFVEKAIPVFLFDAFGVEIKSFFQNPDTQFWAIFLYGFWTGFGTTMLLYINAMNAIPKSVVESVKIDGANSFQEFIHITLPMIFPTFKNMFIIDVSTILMGQFTLYEFFGLKAPSKIQTVGYYLYQQTMIDKGNYPFLAALGIILTFIAIPVALVVRYVFNKIDPMEKQ